MKNKKFITFISIFMLAVMLVSTLSLPVFATAKGEVAEESPTIWEQIFNVITGILAVIIGIIFFILYTIFIIFSVLINFLFVLVEGIIGFFVAL